MSARVIVTGAAAGIGAATAERLRSRGARVVGLDLDDEREDVLTCDVRDTASVERAVSEAVDRLGGGLDVLINNAGVGIPQSAGKAPDEGALGTIDVNLLGPWRVTAAALPALLASRGRVVNVASGLAHITAPFGTAYCMSKRGLVAYSDSLRLEYGDRLTVTTVYPGYIRTAIHASAQDAGVPLEGAVPVESVEGAAGTLVRAALGPPRRDLATSRRGAVGYALARHLPRRVMDRVVEARMRHLVRRGHFQGSELARELAARLGT